MKKCALFVMLFLVAALPAAAQTFDFGLLLGRAQNTDDGLSANFDDSVREIAFATALDADTHFRIKAGSLDTVNFQELGGQPVDADGKIEYVDALVGYDYPEVFGTTMLFAGPGFYRQSFGPFEETNWGLSAGINGKFPVTRKFAFLAEAGYHYAHFDQHRSFITISGGIQIGF